MTRLSRDETYILLASTFSNRGTCARRQVGCILSDKDGFIIGMGYNGVAAGQPHCITKPCKGAHFPSGTGLDQCEAIHAEANALLRCSDPRAIETAYVTDSPCIHCTKLLLNTNCQRILFLREYPHVEAKTMWEASGRVWRKFQFDDV